MKKVKKEIGVGKNISFKAHKSQVDCMELDFSGKKLATASEKVRFFRLWASEIIF